LAHTMKAMAPVGGKEVIRAEKETFVKKSETQGGIGNVFQKDESS